VWTDAARVLPALHRCLVLLVQPPGASAAAVLLRGPHPVHCHVHPLLVDAVTLL
jgi:hypothetical protein